MSKAGTILAWLCLAAVTYAVSHHRHAGWNFSLFRLDSRGAVAYPQRDARDDYMSALAILTGDGWVNWRSTSRWSTYKAGWGGFLAFVAWLCGREPVTMQALLTVLACTAGPLFYTVIIHLFPVRGIRLFAFAPTILFVLSPLDESWWCFHTMTSEGPALILSLVGCIGALVIHQRGSPSLARPFLLGLALGSLCLVREQSRLAVAAIIVLLVLSRRHAARVRLFTVGVIALGVAAVVGPLYSRTSVQLNQLYLGTPVQALIAVLAWTDVGQAAGGADLPPSTDEGTRLRVLSARAKVAIGYSLASLRTVATTALAQTIRFQFAGVTASLGIPSGNPIAAAVLTILAGSGVALAWRCHGLAGTIPGAYLVAYLLPNFLFSFYWTRFGIPVSWVGLAFVAGGCLAPFARLLHVERTGLEVGVDRRMVRRGLVLAAAVLLLWIPGCSSFWLAMDRSELVALRGETAGLSDGEELGVAFLPLVVEPDDPPMDSAEGRIAPERVTYTLFYFVRPWKSDGGFSFSRLKVPGLLYSHFRNGDFVKVTGRSGATDWIGSVLSVEAP